MVDTLKIPICHQVKVLFEKGFMSSVYRARGLRRLSHTLARG